MIGVGTRLGAYEITAMLGKGGMGEVYRASDTRLKRDVAIKLLPDDFSGDSERLSRFQREAEVLASLNHTNIAAIYDLAHVNDTRFLVLELVEGETLAQRINRGRLSVEETLGIARQICEGLEAAHEKSVIHRDLKPANVKIAPDGKVKVLDFGLAKAIGGRGANPSVSNSPTLTIAGTQAGVIIGTAAYMSPEQAKGREADPRSDVFALGCVLFEMLTGRQAFPGDDVSEILASVMKVEPDFGLLPPNLNPRLPELIRRCLAKSPKDRWHAIADLRLELDTIIANPHVAVKTDAYAASGRPSWKWVAAFAMLLIAAVAITANVVSKLRPATEEEIASFQLILPQNQSFSNTSRQTVAISPNGRNIVYVANQQLFLRKMEEIEARPITGTAQNPGNPVFSTDSNWVVFFSNPELRLKKIPVTGGTAITICEMESPYGMSWGPDDQLYVGQGAKGIVRVSANGGKPETVVTVKSGEIAHGPQLLPDGDHLLFTLATATGRGWNDAKITVQSLRTGDRKVILEGGSDARYLPSGHLVYAVDSTLFAVPFDAQGLTRKGGQVPVLEDLQRSSNLNNAAAHFSVSPGGVLVYVPGTSIGATATLNVALVDKTGSRKPLNLPPAPYLQPRISPDGKHLTLYSDNGKQGVVWVYDLSSQLPPRKLTFGGRNHRPLWTPDGKRIVFTSDRGDGSDALYWQPADGSGTAELLYKPEPGITPQAESWTPDGSALLFLERFAGGSKGIKSLSVAAAARTVTSVVPMAGNADLSPGGHWLAYNFTESARTEIFVQPYPPTGVTYQITNGGGASSPLWSPDGKQLFYLQGDNRQLVAVDIQTKPSFVVGKATPLPLKGVVQNGPRSYDITPDGKSFVVMSQQGDPDRPPAAQINVVLHWLDDLKRRVP